MKEIVINKIICKNCKYYRATIGCVNEQMLVLPECLTSPLAHNIDNVSGKKIYSSRKFDENKYKLCSEVNENGDCELFSEKTSFEKIDKDFSYILFAFGVTIIIYFIYILI